MVEVRFERFGGPEVLAAHEVPEPPVGPRAVAVDVRAAGVNHLDLDIRDGSSRLPVRMPHRLGREAAGVVAAVGSEVERWQVGDRVLVSAYPSCHACAACMAGDVNLCTAGMRPGIDVPGGYAERVVVPEDGLFALPDA